MKIKYKEAVSAVVGSAFFAIPYLALSLPLLPSALIGTGAFIAGELLLSSDEKNQIPTETVKKILDSAKDESKDIYNMRNKIEDEDLKKYIINISTSANKIISAIEKEPKKIRKIANFFDYYLPVTLSIIKRYDEIENQNLSSQEMKEFISSTKLMLKSADEAFNKILERLYQNDMINIDADMKVFNSMLKADGYDDEEIIKEDNNE
ncbi:MAG: 5-bromo-4-chloroindolyl phosphate hydrolysis family protein [Tenericutes bacterium]|nr:5-bromo-4-chloroindolyl phosphate hydrolysis family protein [Mycoplasmatota bacterium]